MKNDSLIQFNEQNNKLPLVDRQPVCVAVMRMGSPATRSGQENRSESACYAPPGFNEEGN
ncbi:hypothetical protein GCM10028817_35870 [Spirosoma pomorum]